LLTFSGDVLKLFNVILRKGDENSESDIKLSRWQVGCKRW
jgi:hypothetical protein